MMDLYEQLLKEYLPNLASSNEKNHITKQDEMEELREMYKHINIPIVNRVLNIEQGRSIVDAYI